MVEYSNLRFGFSKNDVGMLATIGSTGALHILHVYVCPSTVSLQQPKQFGTTQLQYQEEVKEY